MLIHRSQSPRHTHSFDYGLRIAAWVSVGGFALIVAVGAHSVANLVHLLR